MNRRFLPTIALLICSTVAAAPPGSIPRAGGEGGILFTPPSGGPPGGWPGAAAPTPAPTAPAPSAALGGEELGDPSWNFRFRPPAGWKHQHDYSGAVLGHDSVAGMLLVVPHSLPDLAAVEREMRGGLREQGVTLQLSGPLQRLGDHALAGEFSGTLDGQAVSARGVGTASPHGDGGAYVIAVTTPQMYGDAQRTAADALAGGMRFVQLELGPLVRHFSDTWVYHSGGGATLINLILSPDGRFERIGETSYSGSYSSSGWSAPDTSWGAYSGSQNAGRWTIRGNVDEGTITLRYGDGRVEEIDYRIHRARGQTFNSEYYFNGAYYFRKGAME